MSVCPGSHPPTGLNKSPVVAAGDKSDRFGSTLARALFVVGISTSER
jgi:hypothetical protein